MHRGVTPATRQYPNLAAGFRRRALFFESPSDANQSVNELSGRQFDRRLDTTDDLTSF